MSASVCPICNALLTTRERAEANCPKCSAALPELPSVKTLSDRKITSRVDSFNSPSFCYRMSLACLALAIAGLLLGCVSFNFETDNEKVNLPGMIFSVVAVMALIGSAVTGFFGLSGGIRNQFVESIVLTAFGLILAGVQLAFWFVSFAGFFSGN